MPWSSAKSRFPLGCHVLQREYAGFIDSTGQFVEWSPERTPIHIDIITYAQMLVEKQLKAPSTAKHPWGSSNYQIAELGDDRYSISSYVDAQNSFGAMIRTEYTVVIRQSGDRWLLESIKTNP